MTTAEITADKLARLLAEHFGASWAALHPLERDQWRDQSEQLLRYLEVTAFSELPERLARHDRLLLRTPDDSRP